MAASLVLVLGLLVLTSAIEAGSGLIYAIATLGIGGALLFTFGIERPSHPIASWARPLGWVAMFAFSLVPTSLLFLPALIVLLALPAVFAARLTRRPGTGASASPAPGPS